MLEHSGWLALAAATAGGARAGDLLQAVDVVRQVFEKAVDWPRQPMRSRMTKRRRGGDPAPRAGKRDVVRVMNLHKAKGLEADVVFLADPTQRVEVHVDVRIARRGGGTGHLTIVRKGDG